MGTNRILISVLLGMSLVACSKSKDDFAPLRQALQKPSLKDHKEKPGTIEDGTKARYEAQAMALAGNPVDNWFTKDSDLDGDEGVSSDKALLDLNLTNKKEVIVAVIDSGVDINHPDLKNKIWVNKGEIPNNQIDDDKNGYVDDVYGWNFIGGHDANGNNIDISLEQVEVTRQLVKLQALQKQLQAQGKQLSAQDQANLDSYSQQVSTNLQQGKQVLQNIEQINALLQSDYNILQPSFAYNDMTADNIKTVVAQTDAQKKAQSEIENVFSDVGIKSIADLNSAKDEYTNQVQYNYNVDFQPRKAIVGDNPDDLTDVHYGNNDVTGPDANHGTHVSGIIAAENNGVVHGIAQNVKIMVVRVVPNGDERDKDVALGIRYAVDNGANIINMSFGKPISPQKYFVGEALKYAQDKGVLVIHASGNDNENKDQIDNYPSRHVYDVNGNLLSDAGTFIDVGASARLKDKSLPATFSDYGQTTVDLFAPGVDIKSTVMGDKYAVFSGTSMASPTTAGVAALILSNNPQLSATELKAVLMKTTKSRAGLSVSLPGDSTTLVPFETLSITGGIVDAYAAIKSLMQ